MNGGIGIPYRHPCGGWSSPPAYFFPPLYRHQRDVENGLDQYVNTTTTHIKTPGATSGTQAPYERWNNSEGGSGSCDTNNCDPGTATCQGWIGTDETYASVQYSLVGGQPNAAPQTFNHTSGAQVNFATCHKRGFKNVAANRVWQGQFGFKDAVANLISGVCFDAGVLGDGHSGFDGFKYSDAPATPPQVKYRTMTVVISGGETLTHHSGSPAPIVVTGGGTIVGSIDPLSGEATLTGSFTDCSGAPSGFTLAPMVSVGVDVNSWFAHFCVFATDDPRWEYVDAGGGLYQQWTGTIPNVLDQDATVTPGSCSRNAYENGAVAIHEDATWTNTTFEYNWSDTEVDGDEGITVADTFSISITLSDPVTADDVYTDLKDLLAHWDLTDDAQYPWRTDGLQQVAPLMSRLEVAGSIPFNLVTTVDDYASPIGSVPYSSWNQRAWFDPAVWQWQFPPGQDQTTATGTLVKLYDGSIQGAPNPAGYQDYFRWDYVDWVGCCFDDGSGTRLFDWYQLGRGMWLDAFNGGTGAQLPRNATQWTNWYSSVNKAPGACLIYADKQNAASPSGITPACLYNGVAHETGLVAVKYAEILDRWPSQNFARPAGADKFLMDEPTVYCATNLSGSGTGSTWTLSTTSGGAVGTFDTSRIWGGPVVGGFYNIAAFSGSVVTLGTQVYDLPSDWHSPSGDDDSCFGRLRFPTAPALLGRVAITPDTAGTTMTFAGAQTAFGLASATHQEQVDFYDKTMTLLATNVTATRTSDTAFTIASAQPNAAFVMIHGAPAYYFNDNYPKGDFVMMDWTLAYRGFTNGTNCDSSTYTQAVAADNYSEFTQTQQCLPFLPCCPSVACFSPNGETFHNGVTVPFPSEFVLDEIYGSRWQGYVMTTMTDLFWQAPHLPCSLTDSLTDTGVGGDSGIPIIWTQDDGTCQANYTDETTGTYHAFYAFPPQVEARISLPNTYGPAQNETPPSLPVGITIGFLSPVTATSGDIAFPPGPIGYDSTGKPLPALSADIMWGRFCNVPDDCPFRSAYTQYPSNCS